jgi:DNA-binding HxlR family transcriptional regulator
MPTGTSKRNLWLGFRRAEVLSRNLAIRGRWENLNVMQLAGDYCAYEKAAEHLADRWVLLIGRELAIQGPLGFNALANALPGISRSVLARRLRKLQDFGLICRDGLSDSHQGRYRLAPAGLNLIPTLMSLNDWAERWIPEDPAVIEHDPDVVTFWLSRRIDGQSLPETPAVLVFQIGGPTEQHVWLVLQAGAEPSLCIEDPLLDQDRYLYVEADADALLPIARGLVSWQQAIGNQSVSVYGDPAIVRSFPAWFQESTAAS